jgi:hypothetical protein
VSVLVTVPVPLRISLTDHFTLLSVCAKLPDAVETHLSSDRMLVAGVRTKPLDTVSEQVNDPSVLPEPLPKRWC